LSLRREVYFFFLLRQKRKTSKKKKANFFNGSAEKNGPYAVDAVRCSATWRWFFACAGMLFCFLRRIAFASSFEPGLSVTAKKGAIIFSETVNAIDQCLGFVFESGASSQLVHFR